MTEYFPIGSATALKDLIDIPVLRINVNLRYMCCESFEVPVRNTFSIR